MPSPSIEDSYRRRWLVLSVLCLSILLTVTANMALNVALPTIGRTLHAGASSLAWVVDTFVLSFAGLLLPGGAAGDRFGRKGTLQCGLVIFAAAAAVGAFSTATWELIAARGVMGVGSALAMPGTLSILATVFPPAERPRAIGIWASVAGGSVALSITWSGAMLENFWWGSIFLGLAALAVVALALGWRLLPTSRHPEQARLDPLGAVLSVAGVTGLLYGFIQAPDDGWTAAPILGAFAAGVVALGAFVAWERRAGQPMLDLRFFAERRFSLGSLAIAAAYFALLGMYFVFTQYLQLVRGYSPLAAGLYALPAGLAQFAVANGARPLVARYGIRPVLTGGLVASAGGLAVLATSGVASPAWVFEVGLGLLGVGIGLTMPPATGAIMSSLPPHKAGVGSAVNDLDRELGGAFGIGVLATVTLSVYRSRLAPALARRPAGVVTSAKQGLAQAVTASGGPSGTLAAAARHAYAGGLQLALAVGAGCVVLAAAAVYLGLRPSRPARLAASAVTPAMNMSTPNP